MAKQQPTPQPESTEVEQYQPIAADFQLILDTYGVQVASTPEDVALQMAERILTATDVASTLDMGGTKQARDMVGETIEITGYHLMRTTLEGDGPGVYAVVNARYKGDAVAITCGARTMLIQLIKWGKENWFPVMASIQQSPERTQRGFRPMWFGAADVDDDASETQEQPF